MSSSSRVIRLDPSRQKLLIPPNEPLPKNELSQGGYDSPSRSLEDYRSRDPSRRGDAYASYELSEDRGAYSDSEWEDRQRGYRDSRSREPRRRHDHWWSRHRRDSRDRSRGPSNSDSEDRYGRYQRHGDERDRPMHRERAQSSSRRQDDESSDGDYSSEGSPRYGHSGGARDGYASRSRPNGQYNAHPTSNAGHIDPSQSHAPSQSHGNAHSQNNYPPSHGYIPSQNDYPPSHGHAPSRDDYDSPHGHPPSQNDHYAPHGHAPSHGSSQDNYHPAPNPQQLMAQLGQQALSSYGNTSHNGKFQKHGAPMMAQLGQQALSSYNAPHGSQPQKHGFLGGLAQAALRHTFSQGQNRQYSQHSQSDAHSQDHGGGRAPSNAQSQYPGNDMLAHMHLPPATQSLLHYAQDEGMLEDLAKYFKVLPPAPDFCYSRCTGRKKAVCIGINYVGQKDELKGCANDARNMREFLIKNYGFKSQDILLLIDDDHSRGNGPRPTRKEMFNAMSWLVKDAKQHDSLFFHYSGHGGQSPDASGKEADGMDEVIFPVDYDDYREEDGPGDIIDDELHDALVHNLPAGVRLTALFDSCHSGTVLDLPYLHSAHGRLRSMGHISRRARQRGGTDAGDVICFAACKDDETSADTREGNVAVGAMSWAFIQSLEQNRNQTYEELLQHLRATLIPKYHQKAQISGTHPVDLHRQFTL